MSSIERYSGTPEIGADPIALRYRKWKHDNPRHYALFVRFAKEALSAGRTRYSIDAIVQRVRWEVQILWQEEFKINDHYSALIARDLILEGVVPEGFFELRRRRAH